MQKKVDSPLKPQKRYSELGKPKLSPQTSPRSRASAKAGSLKLTPASEVNFGATGGFEKYLRLYGSKQTGTTDSSAGAKVDTSVLSQLKEESQQQISFEADQFEAAHAGYIAALYEKLRQQSPQQRSEAFKITPVRSGRPDISPTTGQNPSQWSVNQREDVRSEAATTPFQLMIQRMQQMPTSQGLSAREEQPIEEQEDMLSAPSQHSPTRIAHMEVPGAKNAEQRIKFFQKESEGIIGQLESLNSSKTLGEGELGEIAKLLGSARDKNYVLKNTLALLRKHNYLLKSQNKILKKRLMSNELMAQKLEAELGLREQELKSLQFELKKRETRMEDVMKALRKQHNHKIEQTQAKYDSVLAEMDSKNKRIKDYRREVEALKEDLRRLKQSCLKLQDQFQNSQQLRVGMHTVIKDARKQFKVYCRVQQLADELFSFPELTLGTNPADLHVLEMINGDEKTPYYFDKLFAASSSLREIFSGCRDMLKPVVKGEQVCFLFVNGDLGETERTGSLIAQAFDFFVVQVQNLIQIGNKVKLYFRMCPDGRGRGDLFTMSGSLKSALKKDAQLEEGKQSNWMKDQTWMEVNKFKDISYIVEQHKQFERKEAVSGGSNTDLQDFLIYQIRLKSESDDYLGIFRVFTIFEIKGSLVLNQHQREPSVISGEKVQPSLASFELTQQSDQSSKVSMPGKLLKVISDLVNRNQYTNDLEETLTEGKNVLFLELEAKKEAGELASMVGSAMLR